MDYILALERERERIEGMLSELRHVVVTELPSQDLIEDEMRNIISVIRRPPCLNNEAVDSNNDSDGNSEEDIGEKEDEEYDDNGDEVALLSEFAAQEEKLMNRVIKDHTKHEDLNDEEKEEEEESNGKLGEMEAKNISSLAPHQLLTRSLTNEVSCYRCIELLERSNRLISPYPIASAAGRRRKRGAVRKAGLRCERLPFENLSAFFLK